jgi:hypothetical protein
VGSSRRWARKGGGVKTKTYKVQTWDEKGALKNHYTVELCSTAELAHLKKFLRKSSAHVVVSPIAEKPHAKK